MFSVVFGMGLLSALCYLEFVVMLCVCSLVPENEPR